MLRELSRKKFKNIKQVIKLNTITVCQIIKIDNDFIDLSLKKVDEVEKDAMMKLFKKNKIAYQIVDKAAKLLKEPVATIYKEKCYVEMENHRTLFKYFVYLNSLIMKNVNLTDKYEQAFRDVIIKDYTPQSYHFRTVVDVANSKKNGVGKIKKVFDKVMEFDKKLEIHLLSAPTYNITRTCVNRDDGLDIIKKALVMIENDIKECGGKFLLVAPPRTVKDKSKRILLINEDSSSDDYEEFE
ncbi:IF2A [Hepatospora eriocheir]|uniref:IF2A n=1 Tax=Hepatospora eriocheir TaxID=1081669 RepID=A0A1X0Q6W0_9MICR|nr:IF2A [Hepatospora eriocheir]